MGGHNHMCTHTETRQPIPISLCSSAGYLGLAKARIIVRGRRRLCSVGTSLPLLVISLGHVVQVRVGCLGSYGNAWRQRPSECVLCNPGTDVSLAPAMRVKLANLRGSSKKCTDKTLKGRSWLEGGGGRYFLERKCAQCVRWPPVWGATQRRSVPSPVSRQKWRLVSELGLQLSTQPGALNS